MHQHHSTEKVVENKSPAQARKEAAEAAAAEEAQQEEVAAKPAPKVKKAKQK